MLTGIAVDALIGAGAAPLLADTPVLSHAAAGPTTGATAPFRTLLAGHLSVLTSETSSQATSNAPQIERNQPLQVDPEKLAEVKQAAQQFEALLLYTLLKQMWVSVPEGTLFGQSHAAKFYREMWLEALADEIATKGPGLGIAPLLEREMIALSGSPTFPEGT